MASAFSSIRNVHNIFMTNFRLVSSNGCFMAVFGILAAILKKIAAMLEFLMASAFSTIRDVYSIFIPNFMLVSSNERLYALSAPLLLYKNFLH